MSRIPLPRQRTGAYLPPETPRTVDRVLWPLFPFHAHPYGPKEAPMSSQPRWLRSFQRRNRRESARVQRRTCAVKFHHGPPTGNPGPSEVFRRGLPLLIADRHGDTRIVRNQADYDRITRETA